LALALVFPLVFAGGTEAFAVPSASLSSHKATAGRSAVSKAASDVTSAKERKRSAGVKKPKISWSKKKCGSGGYCGTIKVPLDYDKPKGTKVTLKLFKLKARKPSRRIGTLFVNPGGPGASGIDMAMSAKSLLGKELLDRFDVVGFDPRGTGGSSALSCFSSKKRTRQALKGLGVDFPVGRQARSAYLGSAKALAQACSNKPLAKAMSTAEVARDLDVLRRAVGDSKLSYLGFSYGTYLGQVYANLYPDRVRAMALDGVVDAVEWSGTGKSSGVPMTLRLDSAAASQAVLDSALARCAEAGRDYCELAGDPDGAYDAVVAHLRSGKSVAGYDLEEYLAETRSALYSVEGTNAWMRLTAKIHNAVEALASIKDAEARTGAAAGLDAGLDAGVRTDTAVELNAGQDAEALADAAIREVAQASAELDAVLAGQSPVGQTFGLPASGAESGYAPYYGVLCTDAGFPRDPQVWVRAEAAADKVSPTLGRAWLWSSVPCATKYWKGRDEDAYRGPFNKRTATGVLVVGSPFDPATPFTAAAKTSARLPGSFLLRVPSWGHTSYQNSVCATKAIDRYLVSRRFPAASECPVEPGSQPFKTSLR
jgi:pimeloyl-ACP methyl ester carboxylesterase